jgi:hypothetical protein
MSKAMPSGCVLTRVVSSCPEDDVDVRACLDDSVEQRICDIETRLERGAADGEALPCTEVRTLAEYVDSIVQGMAIRAIEGASRQSLQRIVDIAMRVWDA